MHIAHSQSSQGSYASLFSTRRFVLEDEQGHREGGVDGGWMWVGPRVLNQASVLFQTSPLCFPSLFFVPL